MFGFKLHQTNKLLRYSQRVYHISWVNVQVNSRKLKPQTINPCPLWFVWLSAALQVICALLSAWSTKLSSRFPLLIGTTKRDIKHRFSVVLIEFILSRNNPRPLLASILIEIYVERKAKNVLLPPPPLPSPPPPEIDLWRVCRHYKEETIRDFFVGMMN